MSRLFAFLLLLAAVAHAAPFTAEDARRRQDQARADRAPVDRLVAAVVAGVEGMPQDKWASEDCYTYSTRLEAWHTTAPPVETVADPWCQVASNTALYEPMVRAALETLGYHVTAIAWVRCPVTRECAKGPICAAACYDPPHIRVCWRDAPSSSPTFEGITLHN